MTALEKLLSPEQKRAMALAAGRRRSCRAFTGVVSGEAWAELSYLAGRCTLPDTRLLLLRVQEDLFGGHLGRRIRGCGVVAALTAASAVQGSAIRAGIAGEAFCLQAEAAGYATSWVSEDFRRERLLLRLRLGEELQALIALGYAAPGEEGAPETRKRKSLEKLCGGEPGSWPEEYRRAAALVQAAPSRGNRQPWRLTAAEDRLTVAADKSPLELGIAMLHAELALTSPHQWRTGIHSAWALRTV